MRVSDRHKKRIAAIYPKVQRLARMYYLDDADDLAQHVTLKLLERPYSVAESLDDRWLSAVVRHAAIDRLRGRTCHRRGSGGLRHLPLDPTSEMVPVHDRDGVTLMPLPVSKGRRLEPDVLPKVRELVDALPDRQRLTLELRAEGYDYETIGAMTGVSEGTVKSRLHYAKAKLRRLLAEYV